MDFWNGRDFSNFNGTSCNNFNASSAGRGNENYNSHNQTDGNSYSNQNAQSQDNRADFEKKFEQYKGKSQDELMSELMQVAGKMRADGTFDKQALENFYNNAQGFLNAEQRQRMRSLIDMLG